MEVWVDADATPRAIKEILFKAAQRRGVVITFVANRYQHLPRHRNLRMMVVEAGFDVADQRIVELCQPGDLVITADIPLAGECVEKRAKVVTPRGRILEPENIASALRARDIREELREGGVEMGGPKPMHQREVQAFARVFDQWVQLR